MTYLTFLFLEPNYWNGFVAARQLIVVFDQAKATMCDGRHKMSDLGASVNRFTVEPRTLRLRVVHQCWVVRAGLNGEDHEQDPHAQFRSHE